MRKGRQAREEKKAGAQGKEVRCMRKGRQVRKERKAGA
jgi:hypothetical protein